MSERNKEVLLTRVTIPIDYKDPMLVRAIEHRREELEASKTPEKKIREAINEIVHNWKGKPAAFPVAFMGETLLAHSAQKIFLVDMGEKLTDSVISGLPDFLKPRIELVDKDHKISNSVFKMLKPIGNDLDTIWKKVREKNGASIHDFNGHEHAFCLLGEFLTTLIVATRHNTEADVDVNIITQGIDRVKKQVQSQESKTLISRIEGILNCYRISRQIPSISPAAQIVPRDLLMDLLDDANVIDLSKERYYLGIPSKAKIALVKTRQKIREILAVPRNRKYLAMASKLGNLATKQVNIELPEIDIQRESAFSPPFISLEEMKPNCLRTNRKLSDIDPLHFL